jgi:hypothetical protein
MNAGITVTATSTFDHPTSPAFHSARNRPRPSAEKLIVQTHLDYGGVDPCPPVAAPWLLGCPVRASTTRYLPTSALRMDGVTSGVVAAWSR